MSRVAFRVDQADAGDAMTAPFFVDYSLPLISGLSENPIRISAQAVLGGHNAALGSSVEASARTGDYLFPPELAVDGNTDSVLTNGSVALLVSDTYPWISLDLGKIVPMERIDVHFMEGCCEAYNRIAVLVATEPFVESDLVKGLPDVFSNDAQLIYQTGQTPDIGVVSVAMSNIGQYIMIVGLNGELLSLAEVEVIARAYTVSAPEITVTVTSGN